MEKFTKLTSIVAPYAQKDVDTDLIIPAQYLTSTSREGYAEGLFRRVRENDAQFYMHDQKYAGTEILAVGPNFACGSSREHAVWALQGAGFRVIIGTTFADIFTSNSAKNGLLLVQLPKSVMESILARAASESLSLTVDLESQAVVTPEGTSYGFEYDPFRKTCLLEGLDDLEYLLKLRPKIRAHFDQQVKQEVV